MIVDLSDYLRSTLASTKEPSSTLSDEVALLKQYFTIEKHRFGDRLRVQWELDPQTLKLCMPTLLLQPLVENAIKYGDWDTAESTNHQSLNPNMPITPCI